MGADEQRLSVVRSWCSGAVTARGADVKSVTLLAGSDPVTEAPSTVTHYANTASQGTGDGSSPANAFTVADFFALPPQPGDHLQMADGTYTNPSGFITPTGISGASNAPITVSAETDGGVIINGGGSRPVSLSSCNWWIVQGIDAYNGDSKVMSMVGSSSNNIFRRCIGWDCDPTVVNSGLISIGSDVATPCSNNLVEDCAAFGYGRRMFISSQGAEGTTFRRCWHQGHRWYAFQFGYQCHDNLVENCVGSWDKIFDTSEDWEEARCVYGIGRIDKGVGGEPLEVASNSRVYGIIAYIPAHVTITPYAIGSRLARAIEVHPEQGDVHWKDIVVVTENASPFSNNKCVSFPNLTVTSPQSTFHDTTTIRGVNTSGNSIGTAGAWNLSNNVDVATVAEAPSPFQTSAGSGARVYYRYVDGVLQDGTGGTTATPLWPWPMDARIRQALTRSGRNPDTVFNGTGNSVTQMMEQIFNVSLP